MAVESTTTGTPSRSLTILPQLVPSRVCLRCDVCCRFPEADSVLRPYFTAVEIGCAVEQGVPPQFFPSDGGAQIALVANPHGEGYLCPAFDPATSQCRIYEARPLDCQLYPLALMWNAAGDQVVLGWDTKCPYLHERGAPDGGPGAVPGEEPEPFDLEAYAETMAAPLESTQGQTTVAQHSRLIGPFQDDVVILRSLPRLTRAVTRETLVVRRGRSEGQDIGASHGSRLTSHEALTPRAVPLTSDDLPVRPLTLADRPRVELALEFFTTPLAAYAFAPHMIWRGLFTYSWAEWAGYLCLFAEYQDGLFMPLPPLGPQPATGHGADANHPLADALAQAFAFMRTRNQGRPVSRIENVPEEWLPALEVWGYSATPKDPDYLYFTRDLVRLAGDRFKSQRAAYNGFVRARQFSYHPYREVDQNACLALYRKWASQREARGADPVEGMMRKDAESAHREALSAAHDLGLMGRIVRVDGRLRAYTFGYPRSRSVFTVLLEIADRSIPGLAQFIFRELCREADAQGYECINTMDDSGLPNLARSKMAYRPLRQVPSFIVTEHDA
ncbi:MAG: phosphatidylglycerol lysyltransferase domain-containing protein [Nitrospirales bacterium]